MLCTCNICLFTFERACVPDACPDCGTAGVREAAKCEREEYDINHAAFDHASDGDDPLSRGTM